MSMLWGPAIDAELGYRQQQVKVQFRRSQHRRAARSTPRVGSRTGATRQAQPPLVVRAA